MVPPEVDRADTAPLRGPGRCCRCDPRTTRPFRSRSRVSAVPSVQHGQNGIELVARQVAVGVAGLEEVVEAVDVPGFRGGHGENDLRQDVQRRVDRDAPPRCPVPDGPRHHRRIAAGRGHGSGKQRPGWPRPPRGRNGPIRCTADETVRGVCTQDHAVETSDVDPQLQGTGRDDRLELALLELLLHGKPDLPGKRTVVRVGEVLLFALD